MAAQLQAAEAAAATAALHQATHGDPPTAISAHVAARPNGPNAHHNHSSQDSSGSGCTSGSGGGGDGSSSTSNVQHAGTVGNKAGADVSHGHTEVLQQELDAAREEMAVLRAQVGNLKLSSVLY